MNCETVCSLDDRMKWLAHRRKGVGSSDAPAILGVSPFKSALAVYREKIQEVEDREETEAMKWGKILEPLIIQEFAAETRRAVHPANSLLRNMTHDWMMATLDAEQSKTHPDIEDGILEIKATGYRMGDWTEGIPAHVMVQAQHQLAVTGYKWGSVCVLERGCRLRWADFERDDKFIDEVLIPTEAEFWRRVVEREPVQPDGSDSARAALKALYPMATPGLIVPLPGDFIDIDKELQLRKDERDRAKEKVEFLEQQIIAALGEAEAGELLNGVAYTYRLQKRDGYTVKPTSFRVLRRSAPKGR